MGDSITLDRSEYLQHRLSLMKTLQLPTISETKSILGPDLSQILFKNCDISLKEDFGLIPLKGTGDDLWISPSDLLIGKVALKPPLSRKYIQALTHNGILTIGQDIEKKFWNETKMHEDYYFESRKRHILDQFEELFRGEGRAIEQRERQAAYLQNQRLIDEFDMILNEELDNLEAKLREEQEEALMNQKKMLDEQWDRKFKGEVTRTVEQLTEKFLNEMDKQKNILNANFKIELQKAHLQRGYDVNMEKTQFKESMEQLRHNLECKNIANMMYILCMERRKCCHEKKSLEQYYTKEISRLNKLIHDKDHQIKTLKEFKQKKIMEVNLRESCLLEIIKQFQKFINFALRAAPTQAEFLLSLEKMMAFELTHAVLHSNYYNLKPCNEILPWKYKENSEIPESAGLVIEDHHNCFDEITPPETETALDEERFLPAFHYKDKLYVREDFRNMISQGMQIASSNALWSKDVEILIQTLRKSISKIKSTTEHYHVSTDYITKEKSFSSSKETVGKSVAASSVQFVVHEVPPERESLPSQEDNWMPNVQLKKPSEERRSSLKPALNSLHTINFESIGLWERKHTLIAATNSLELISKRLSTAPPGMGMNDVIEADFMEDFREELDIDTEEDNIKAEKDSSEISFRIIKGKGSQEGSSMRSKGSRHSSRKAGSPIGSEKDALALDTRDSIIMKKTSLLKKSAEFTIMPKDSIEIHRESFYDIKRKTSKLVSAKNSVEMLRESRMFSEVIICTKRDSSKLKSAMTCPRSKCDDKCVQTKDVLEQVNEILDDEVRHVRKESCDRSIKLSHIEIIKVKDTSKEANVAINATPTIYESGSSTYSTDLEQMYKDDKKAPKQQKKKKVVPVKEHFLNMPNTHKIIGDPEAREHLQTTEEFTKERIHSLIELIKDNPTLMRTFTACTR